MARIGASKLGSQCVVKGECLLKFVAGVEVGCGPESQSRRLGQGIESELSIELRRGLKRTVERDIRD